MKDASHSLISKSVESFLTGVDVVLSLSFKKSVSCTEAHTFAFFSKDETSGWCEELGLSFLCASGSLAQCGEQRRWEVTLAPQPQGREQTLGMSVNTFLQLRPNPCTLHDSEAVFKKVTAMQTRLRLS